MIVDCKYMVTPTLIYLLCSVTIVTTLPLRQVENQKCTEIPREVARQECVTVPRQVCVNVPKQVEKEICNKIPRFDNMKRM